MYGNVYDADASRTRLDDLPVWAKILIVASVCVAVYFLAPLALDLLASVAFGL